MSELRGPLERPAGSNDSDGAQLGGMTHADVALRTVDEQRERTGAELLFDAFDGERGKVAGHEEIVRSEHGRVAGVIDQYATRPVVQGHDLDDPDLVVHGKMIRSPPVPADSGNAAGSYADTCRRTGLPCGCDGVINRRRQPIHVCLIQRLARVEERGDGHRRRMSVRSRHHDRILGQPGPGLDHLAYPVHEVGGETEHVD